MEKPQLINFIAKVMENSGFKVYKNFKTSQNIIDIYAVLPTTFGDFGVVVECNNYDKDFPVSIETLKHMEKVGEAIKASKVVVVTSSYFTEQAMNYALKKNIKLVDRSDLLGLAKKYQDDNFILDREDFHDMGYYGDLVPISIESSNKGEDEEESEYDDYYVDDREFDNYLDDYDDYYGYDNEYGYDYDNYVENQRKSHPAIYQNSLYRKSYKSGEDEGIFSFIKSRLDDYMGLSDNQHDISQNYPVNSLHRSSSNVPAPVIRQSSLVSARNSFLTGTTLDLIKPYLGNPIILIILVVLVTWLVSFIGGSILKANHVIISSLQIVISLVLSYGFSYFFGDKSETFIIRGTVVFFISLILLIILILL